MAGKVLGIMEGKPGGTPTLSEGDEKKPEGGDEKKPEGGDAAPAAEPADEPEKKDAEPEKGDDE